MGQGTERVERDLDAERRDLGRNLKELERRAHTLTDWRWYYRNYPFAVLGTAFGGAALLGLLTRPRSSGPSWGSDAQEYDSHGLESGGYESRAYEASGYEPNHAPSRGGIRAQFAPHFATSAGRAVEQAGVTLDHIVDALLGVAASKAIDFVGRHISGFSDEYTRRHGTNQAF